MTTSNDHHPENVPGRFYVTDDCITCDLCFAVAAETFRMAEDGSQSVVYHQPEGIEEVESAEEALESCPVDAIWNDGEG